jgi:two-component system chemotaxis response regulator CheB
MDDKKIRVLVVDDSALMRKMIPQILTMDPNIEIVGTAMDGLFALKKIAELKPDIITLDVDMPRMDGLTALPHIVKEYDIPVLLISSLTEKGAATTLKGLELGAVDFVTKPREAISVHIMDIANEILQKIKAIAKTSASKLKLRESAPQPMPKRLLPLSNSADKVVAIGISTGGPNALSFILPQIPKDFSAGIVIVQHMPEGFTELFAARLNQLCQIEVKEARDGDLILPGRALIAPGNIHLKAKRMPLGGIAVLSRSQTVSGHRPSADVLFTSVAAEYGENSIGVIMTGMGDDGADGIGRIKASGGMTIAQDEESCIVFGMPKAAIERGYIDKIAPLEEMPLLLERVINKAGERVGQGFSLAEKEVINARII